MSIISKLDMEECRPIISWNDCVGKTAAFTTGEKNLRIEVSKQRKLGILELGIKCQSDKE